MVVLVATILSAHTATTREAFLSSAPIKQHTLDYLDKMVAKIIVQAYARVANRLAGPMPGRTAKPACKILTATDDAAVKEVDKLVKEFDKATRDGVLRAARAITTAINTHITGKMCSGTASNLVVTNINDVKVMLEALDKSL